MVLDTPRRPAITEGESSASKGIRRENTVQEAEPIRMMSSLFTARQRLGLPAVLRRYVRTAMRLHGGEVLPDRE